MQKSIKRTISILLSILMIVGVCAIVPITASAVTRDDIYDLYDQMNMLAGEREQQDDYDAASALYSFSTVLDYQFYESGFNADDPNVERAYNIASAVYNHFNGTGSVDVTSVSRTEVDKLSEALEDLMYDYMMSGDRYSSRVLDSADSILRKAYNAADGNSEDQNLLSAYSLASFILAQYTGTTGSYTVTWNNWDGSVLETDTDVAEGTTPTYDGTTPAKADDAQNTYTFSGWSDGNTTYGLSDTLPAVSGDVTYTAVFTAEAITYTVTWNNWNGSLLETDENVAVDSTPSYDGEVPTKDEDEQNTYEFAGWSDGETTYGLSDTLPAVSGDVTYTAVFTAETKTYTVTWKNWDGSVLETDEDVEAGATPTYDGEDPVKPEDDENVYEFAGWDPEVSAVSGDVEYTAQFTEGVKEIINGKYYVDGILTKGAGLVKYQGDYYYIKQNGTLFKNGSLNVTEAKANGLLPASNYTFDEDGKLQLRNGVVHGKYYVDGVLTKGVGAVEFNGDIYYVKQNGSVLTDSVIIVPAAKANDLVTPGSHRFGADGKYVH